MSIFWVSSDDQARLGIVLRPRGGDWLEDELLAMKQGGVDVLVSMLTPAEQHELGLQVEADLCEKIGVRFYSFPIQDREVPESMHEVTVLLRGLQAELKAGKSVTTHCRASIGRASLLLAAILCQRGWEPQQAWEAIEQARGMHVPDTEEQRKWLSCFAEQGVSEAYLGS